MHNEFYKYRIMKLVSILGSISKTLDVFNFSDTLLEKNIKSAKRIKSLEKTILSQGESSLLRYTKLTEAISESNIAISDKAINNSVRSRIRNKKEFYPIAQLLSRANDKGIILGNEGLDYAWLHEAMELHFQEYPYPEMYLEFLTFIDETKIDLTYELIIRSLQDLKSKTNKLLKTYIQFPIIAAFLEYFDQVFTLKDNEITYSNFHNSFNINVKTNKYRNGQSIYGFIPITS